VYHIKFIFNSRETKPPPPPPPPPQNTQRCRQINRERNLKITQTIDKLSKTGGGERHPRHLVIIWYIGRRHSKNVGGGGGVSIKKLVIYINLFHSFNLSSAVLNIS